MNDLIEKIKKLQADAPALRNRRPRHYAEQICSLKTKEERNKALLEVPEEWRDLVKKHVENEFMRRKR